jgi:hypothetical protein
MPTTPFQRSILCAALRDVYPMVIRLVAVPDRLDLTDFDDVFHAVLGWAGGSGYAFHAHGQEYNSVRPQTPFKTRARFTAASARNVAVDARGDGPVGVGTARR